MATFTRVVHESLGGVAVTNTYSMRGDFQPDAAFKALGTAHKEAEAPPPVVVTPTPPAPGYPMDHFIDPAVAKRMYLWRAVIDERTSQHDSWWDGANLTMGYGIDPRATFERPRCPSPDELSKACKEIMGTPAGRAKIVKARKLARGKRR